VPDGHFLARFRDITRRVCSRFSHKLVSVVPRTPRTCSAGFQALLTLLARRRPVVFAVMPISPFLSIHCFRGAGTVPLRAGCPPAFGAIPWSSGPKQAQNPPAQPIPPPPRARVKRARALANLLRAPRETYTYSDAQIQRADPTHPGTDPSLSSAPCATRGLHTQSPRTRSSHLPGSRKLRESRTVGARSCTDSNPPRLC
jgi:hypothetical protein